MNLKCLLITSLITLFVGCNSQNDKAVTQPTNDKCWKVINPTPTMARNIMKINECTGQTWGLYEDIKTKSTFWGEIH